MHQKPKAQKAGGSSWVLGMFLRPLHIRVTRALLHCPQPHFLAYFRVAGDPLGAVAKRCAVSEDLSAAGHITSSGVTRPGAAKFTALKRFPEADRTDGGRLILSIDEVCFTDCHLSDRPFSHPLDLQRLDRYVKYAY